MSMNTTAKLATSKDAVVICQSCGRNTKRKSRQQSFCSYRCRDRARRERKATERVAWAEGYYPTLTPTEVPKKMNEINNLEVPKTASSIPINLIDGHRWPGARINRDLARKIIRTESRER